MFMHDNETYDDYQSRIKRRADILFPTMKDKEEKKKRRKILGLGEIDFDDDAEITIAPKSKRSELDALMDMDKKDKKSSERKSRHDRTPEEEEEFLNEFYPSMRDKKKKNTDEDEETPQKTEKTKTDKNDGFTGGAADVKQASKDMIKVPETIDVNNDNTAINKEKHQSLPEKIKEYFNNIMEKHNKDKTPLLKASIEKSDLKLSDQNFIKSVDVVFKNEGGFNDDPDDLGGRTNMGITQKTYDDYCRRHGLEKKDVKNLTKEEAAEVYYNDYWKASGADKISSPAGAMVVFDTAVLHGPGRAKQFYKQSQGNLDKMIELRKEYYAKRAEEKPSQKKFLKGWNNRADKLYKIIKEYEENDD